MIDRIYIEKNKAFKLVTEDGKEIIVVYDGVDTFLIQAAYSNFSIIPDSNNSIKINTIDNRVPHHIKRSNNIDWCKNINLSNHKAAKDNTDMLIDYSPDKRKIPYPG